MVGDVFSGAAVEDGDASCLAAKLGSSSFPFQEGEFVHCPLLLRGVVSNVKSVIVKSGPMRTVLACPAAVGIASSGEWAGSEEACFGASFHCVCRESNKSCAVVFYDVRTEAISLKALPGAIDFTTPDEELALPAKEDLLALFQGEAQGDFLTMQTNCGAGEESKTLFHEVAFGGSHEMFSWNSVLLLPDFLTKDDCHVLIDAADRSAHSGSSASGLYSIQNGMSRVPVKLLDLEAQMLSASIFSRLLRILEEQFPAVCERTFGRHHIQGMSFSFWPGEPAINRYLVGGGLDPHTDKRSFTINIPLSDLGAYTGGGTIFWPQEQSGPKEHRDIDRDGGVLLRPCQGSAVLFNGSVTHAARYVTSGIRHIFSASFNLWSLDDDDDDDGDE